MPGKIGAFPPRVLKFFRAPFALEGFSARTGVFLAAGRAFLTAVVAFFSACFLGARATFLAGLADFTLAVDALGRAAFFLCAFGLAGFFEAFFFGDLAIISVSPLVSRARAEA
ncbi:MAG TPA: hypothetical protein VF345_05235 [Chthoniobacterales bacterium]